MNEFIINICMTIHSAVIGNQFSGISERSILYDRERYKAPIFFTHINRNECHFHSESGTYRAFTSIDLYRRFHPTPLNTLIARKTERGDLSSVTQLRYNL